MLNLAHPNATITRSGFGGIYRATAQMESGVSVYFIDFADSIVCIPLTPGWWQTVYQQAALLPYQNVYVITPSTNILMLSDCWRIIMDLMALKKNVTLIADFTNVKIDVPTVYDFCVNLPSIKDEDTILLPDNTTIKIFNDDQMDNCRYIDITYGTHTLRLAPAMTDPLLTKSACDVGTYTIEKLATPWRSPILGLASRHDCLTYINDYPLLKGHIVPFDFSCAEEFYEMQQYAREYRWFLEPHKHFMGVGVP